MLEDSETQAVKIGTTIGNIGLEGISYDPLTSGTDLGFIGVKESGPQNLWIRDSRARPRTGYSGEPFEAVPASKSMFVWKRPCGPLSLTPMKPRSVSLVSGS